MNTWLTGMEEKLDSITWSGDGKDHGGYHQPQAAPTIRSPLWPAITVVRTKVDLHILLCLGPIGQPVFLLGTVFGLQSPYFYPDSNNQILEELFEELTVFFV